MATRYLYFRLSCVVLLTLPFLHRNASAQTGCAPVPPGLVSWWRGENNANDSIGTNNGTLVNGATYGLGEVGQAFSVNGAIQFVQIPDAPGLNPTNALTIEAWVYLTGYSGNDSTVIASKEDPYGARQYQLAMVNVGGNWVFRAAVMVPSGFAIYTGTIGAKLNTWYHVSMTYDGSALKVFINSTLDGSIPVTGAINVTGNPFRIGSDGSGPWNFVGLIDELSLYNRALSTQEIAAIFNAGNAGKCITPTPPIILLEPTDQTVFAGGAVTFNAAASGTEPLSYQWLFDGTNLAGATTSTLTLSNVLLSQAGPYALAVTNNYGWTVSSNAILTVNAPPACAPTPSGLVSWWAAESTANDSAGTNNGLTPFGIAYAAGEVRQAFSFNQTSRRVSIPDNSNFYLTNSLSIEGWVNIASDGGFIFFRGDDRPGLDPYSLTMGASGYINFNIESVTQVMTITAPISYHQWNHVAATLDGNTGDMKLYVNGLLAAQTNTTIRPFGPLDPAYEPAVGIGNHGGTVHNFAFNGLIDEIALYSKALTQEEIQAVFNAGISGKCLLAPTIWTQPADQTTQTGNTARFGVLATGSQPLAYQWTFNGTNLLDATNALLSIPNAQSSDQGAYAVLITNSVGSATSSNAMLSVLAAPPCTSPASNLVSWWRADSNALDQVSANNGSLIGNVTYTAGRVGQAFTFGGSTDAVQLGNPPSLQLQDFTIEGWIKRSSTSVSSQNNPNFGFIFSCAWGGYGVGLWNDGRLALSQVGYSNISSTNRITDLDFHHVAVTKSGTTINFYIDGLGELSSPYGPSFVFNGPSAIGARGGDFNSGFFGTIDELSVYSRPLSGPEIQAIYNSGGSGKCVVPVSPFFLSQPVNSAVTVGANVTFSAVAAGSPPLSYQWQFKGNDIGGATDASLTLTNVQFSQAGNYSVVVTNAAGSITSSNALLNVVFPPAIVEVMAVSNAPSGGSVTVPVLLVANGNENGLSFSLNFPPAVLGFVDVSLGSGASGASLVPNTNQVSSGTLGVAVVFPAGVTSAPGTQDVVDVTFSSVIVTNSTTAFISFGDQPIPRDLADASANPLAANYINGTVQIAPAALEGDVWPRPNGDEALTISDWVLMGRYVAGLDFPTNSSEFQRADCAPRSTLGDGQITVIDWVQVGRYLAGLDPLTSAGGPTNATSNAQPMVLQPAAPHKLGGSTRELLVTTDALFSGQTATARVNLLAQGNENALGFSIDYDPTLVSLAAINPGANASAATFDINTYQAGSGRIGVVLALPVGTSFAVGTQELVKLSFQTISTNTAASPVSFADLPVLRQVSDSTATPLTATYVDGSLSINPLPPLSILQRGQNISLSWPPWATNYSLQQAKGGLPPFGFWSNVLSAPALTNNQILLTLPIESGPNFYRLSKP